LIYFRDTAGQERFHTITSKISKAFFFFNIKMYIYINLASYYRGATGIMLVYDVTQARSFENINKWLRNIDDHASDDVVKMLIGNKCDMDDKRCINRSRGEALAREHAIPFLETSAKNNINIEKAFFEMARLILKKTPVNSSDPSGGGSVGVLQGNKQTNQSNCINCV
jgi:Ras-related protein Rab-10